MEKTVFQACLSAIPSDSYQYYTDGSSYGNPGPAGAGAVRYCRGTLTGVWSRSLGVATNDAAELEGILLALEDARTTSEPLPIYVFVDNRAAVRVAIGRASPEWCPGVVDKIRAALDSLSALHEVHFFWVPGHADVEGNELADRAAKVGAMGITQSYAVPEDLPRIVPPVRVPAELGASGPHDGKVAATVPTVGCVRCEVALGEAIASARRCRRQTGGFGPSTGRGRANRVEPRPQRRHRYGTRLDSTRTSRPRRVRPTINCLTSDHGPRVISGEPITPIHMIPARVAPRGSKCPGANFPT